MIDATIKMTVSREKRKEVLQTLTAILGPIRREKGCLSCNCYVDVEAETTILFKEEWQSGEDLDTHLRSVLFGVLVDPDCMALAEGATARQRAGRHV